MSCASTRFSNDTVCDLPDDDEAGEVRQRTGEVGQELGERIDHFRRAETTRESFENLVEHQSFASGLAAVAAQNPTHGQPDSAGSGQVRASESMRVLPADLVDEFVDANLSDETCVFVGLEFCA